MFVLRDLIAGACSQIAKADNAKFVLTGKSEPDVSYLTNASKVLGVFKPDVVINCSAFYAVEKSCK
jgi:dTDP-4-dehydrorhamnose reductase